MSLSFSSPSPGTKRRFPLSTLDAGGSSNGTINININARNSNNTNARNNNAHYSDDREKDTRAQNTPSEGSFSPLGNPTVLGQLRHPYIDAAPSAPASTSDRTDHDPAHKGTYSRCRPQHPPASAPVGGAPENGGADTDTDTDLDPAIRYRHLYVLPVLLLEFLAIALTRAVLPSILIEEYGSNVYVVLGIADCIRGVLAFFACPLFGKLSDVLGRKLCLFVTVLGSCAPVCSLAFFDWDANDAVLRAEGGEDEATALLLQPLPMPPLAIPLFVVLLSLSGLFSSTFPLVFAYISDSVQERNERVTAYGLALATFGLSFTIGPMAGGYLANSKTGYVFRCSLGLTILDLLYIYAVLPESIAPRIAVFASVSVSRNKDGACGRNHSWGSGSSVSSFATASKQRLLEVADSVSWNPWDSIRLVLHDPFLRKVGQVAFFYYTGLWAVISTLSLYAVQHFHMTPQVLGELMSALGLSTMVAEAVLVRFLVPLLGEKRAIRIGLVSFGLQCLVLGAANEAWQLFFCVGLSLLGNLVYPSLSSLVTGIVEPETVGEALGAINGIKALTEGLGPLVFGSLMTVSEHTAFPGSPYWLAGILVFVAHHLADKLPANSDPILSPSDHDFAAIISSSTSSAPAEPEYIHELEFKKRYAAPHTHAHTHTHRRYPRAAEENNDDDDCLATMFPTRVRDGDDEEYQGLLSEVDEDTDEEWEEVHAHAGPSTRAVSHQTIFRDGHGDGDDNDNDEPLHDLSFAKKPEGR